MTAQNLPQNYRGYSTKELLELWDNIPAMRHDSPEVPGEKVLAMRGLLAEYRLDAEAMSHAP